MKLKYDFDDLKTEERLVILSLWNKPGVNIIEDKIELKSHEIAFLYLLDLTKYNDIPYTHVLIFENKDDLHLKRFSSYLEALKAYNTIKKIL